MDGRVPAAWRISFIAAAVAGCLLAASAAGEEARDGDPVSIGVYRTLRSEALGEDRTLLICPPRGYEGGTAAYPLLFVLYGDHVRGYLAETVHAVDQLSGEGRMPGMIVVGVANVDRYRDLSPLDRQGRPSGIEPFSRFFVEELVPFLEREYRTADYRVLVGPQAGAEFAIYSLAKRPGLFDALVIENPFRYPEVHDALIPMMEGMLAGGFPAYTFLQIAAADRAGPLDKSAEMGYLRDFDAAVREKAPRNLVFVTHYIEGSEDFLPPMLIREGLRGLFRDFRFPGEREVKGLADITSYYGDLSARYGFAIDIPEMTLAFEADELSANGAVDRAIEVLEYLVENNPSSIDGYWRLANLHRERGDRERALEYYRACLEIMPGMPPALYWIEQLEKEEE